MDLNFPECDMFESLSPALDTLTEKLHYLPGIGRKTAQRLALFILRQNEEQVQALADAILRVKKDIHFCRQCFNITEQELCRICLDTRRDQKTICVVEDIVDIFAIEKSNEYRGLYHVLGGVISPLNGVAPDHLKIRELVDRVEKEGVEEILLALNPSTEGEATMIYLSKLIKPSGIRVTRIASGIPIGSHLEYIDDATIGRAILSRREL
jgi:recombination protein RecR